MPASKAHKDWLPTKRNTCLAIAKNWLTILAAQGAAWGVPHAPEELPLVFTTKRKRETITFNAGDWGTGTREWGLWFEGLFPGVNAYQGTHY